jgi:hypothetical protein
MQHPRCRIHVCERAASRDRTGRRCRSIWTALRGYQTQCIRDESRIRPKPREGPETNLGEARESLFGRFRRIAARLGPLARSFNVPSFLITRIPARRPRNEGY